MKILKHGNVIKFTCSDCGCEFTEIAKKCYSSSGEDGSNYCENCPDCNHTCWTTDEEQKKIRERRTEDDT